MATLGHIAVGLAAGRLYYRPSDTRGPRWFWNGAYTALSALPDVDLVGFLIGVDYADPWGHRGATHSLAFAIAIGAACAAAAAWSVRLPALRTFVTATLVVASHGLLDSFTDGGLGCAFLWPFDDTRYFAPWNPLPHAPTHAPLFSSSWLRVLAVEAAIFAPLVALALWPRRRVRGLGS